MTGRIVGGRQEPEPGTKRHVAMSALAAWLDANPAGATYLWLADNLPAMAGSVRRVQDAALDLHLFTDMVVSVPAPRNGYRVRAHWNDTSKWGESNQSRHNGTRASRQAVRLEKGAVAEADPLVAALLRMASRSADAYAKNMADLDRALS